MAIPDVLLKAVGSSSPTGKNLLATLGEAPFPSEEGASFSSVMAEASADVFKADADGTQKDGSEAGKALPELPGRLLNLTLRDPVQLRFLQDADQSLEEFAVGMGIDRGLVRLLLSETAPPAGVNREAIVEDAPPAAVASPTIASMSPTAAVPTSQWVSSMGSSTAMTDDESPRLAAEATTTVIESTSRASSTPVDEPTPIAPKPIALKPIADEDLLLWRSSLSIVSGTPMSALPADGDSKSVVAGPLPMAMRIPESTSERFAPAATSEQLRSRTVAPATSDVMTDAQDTFSSVSGALRGVPTSLAASTSALAQESGRRPRGISFVNDPFVPSPAKASVREDIAQADAGEFAEFMDGRAWSGAERGSAAPVRPLATASMVVSMVAEPRLDGATISTPTAPLGTLAPPTSFALLSGTAQSALTQEPSMALLTPDPKLSFSERVQAFADAVAQRVMGQIRDENWSVRLQLEPANLGTMDIDLSLKGNVVAATVGVANQDVRVLLESGLPRLRESLESAGLQLSGWNFGQAGSRAFNDSARKFSSVILRGQIDETASVPDVDAAPRMPIKGVASGKIDLFV